ncbi:MAG: hypothetical protein NC402_02080 [Prevotella sp.]|nr:hypothetical protein [Prevotella sp.]MCM1074311.1 hypothetical protein [Ruminococcus sp.]
MSNSVNKENETPDGLKAYEFLVDNINGDKQLINKAVCDVIEADNSGQFCASAARFLSAIDADNFLSEIDSLLKSVIEKDREKHYMPALLPTIWGDDYMVHAEELRDSDDNFRRIFKRVHPTGII